MKIIVQTVKKASVLVNKSYENSINRGFMVLVGFTFGDNESIVDKIVYKLQGLRVFEDENGKMNRSLKDIDGEMLIASNFTLYADMEHGFRPSFIKALEPVRANELYLYFVDELKKIFSGKIQTGEFGADMEVSLINEGPKTFVYEIL